MPHGNSEIVVDFQLTPELWFRASRLILQRRHRWLSLEAAIGWVPPMLFGLGWLDHSPWFDEGLQPLLILLNLIVLLGGAALLSAPALIRRKFDRIYQQLPVRNRQVVWKFSPFHVSAEGGMTRFDGSWADIHTIIASPDLFLVFRSGKSAAGVIPVTAFADAEAVEDFVFLARARVAKYVKLT